MSGKGAAVAGIMKPALSFLIKHADDVGGKAGKEVAEKAAKEAAEKTARKAGKETAEDTAKREARDAAGKATSKDPIDLATGEVLLTQTDVRLQGVLPLVLERTHLSSHRRGRLFGMSWASTLDQHLQLETTGISFAAADGMVLRFPQVGLPRVITLPIEGTPHRQLVMTTDGGYTLTDTQTGRSLHFPAPGDRTGWSRLPLTAVTDRTGNRIDLLYDEGGALAEVCHPGGYRIAVDTAPHPGATARTDTPAGQAGPTGAAIGGATDVRVTALRLLARDAGDLPGGVTLMRFGYDDAGDLTEVINGSGLPLRFSYDGEHRLTGWHDRNGFRYGYTYDEHGRAIAGTGTGGYLNARLTFHQPDASGVRRTTETDSLGHATVHEFNSDYQLIARTDPLGSTTRYERDRHNRITARIDPLGGITRYAHDSAGNLMSLIRPDGSTIQISYNEFNLPVQVTEPDGAIWRHAYDQRANLIALTDPADVTTTYEYNDHGHLTAVRDGLGAVTRIRTDAAGLPLVIIDPLGATTRIARDVFGRAASVTDPLGGVTHHGWTIDGEPAWRTGPDGATERWSYDAEGNQIEYADATGHVTRTDIGPFDLPVSVTGPDGARLELAYDTELRMTAVTNPQSLVWRYVHDPAGNLISETDFNGHAVTYAYDRAGRLTARTNAAGQSIAFTRDALGNVIEKRSGGAVTSFTRDAAGRLLRAVGPDADLRLQYDPLGRVTTEECNGRALVSGYDAVGNQIHRRTPTGAVSTWTVDAAGRCGSLRIGGRTLVFDRDEAGRETQRRIGSGVVLTQQWDAAHRLTAQSVWAASEAAGTEPPAGAAAATGRTSGTTAVGPRLLQHRTYAYLPDDSLIAIGDRLSGDRRYDLDSAGRVTAVNAHGWTERYAYDTAGNITSATWPARENTMPLPAGESTAGPPRQSEGAGERHYAGSLIHRAGSIRYEYDAQGRVVLRQHDSLSAKPVTWRFQWDADDRLIAVTTPDGGHWRYLYDPLGRRIAKQRLTPDGRGVLEQVDFTWDGPVLAEQTRQMWSPEEHRYVVNGTTTWEYEAETFRPLAELHRAFARDASQQWIDQRFQAIITDLAGSPSELVDGDADGDLIPVNRTTLWGGLADALRDDQSCPLRFPGQYFDPETGLHYNYHRYYDPTTGRYATSDPLGIAPQHNPYAYVHNPLMWIDPLGLSAYDPRKLPGKANGSAGVPDVSGRWLRGSHGNAGRMPGQIARRLEGRHFNNWDDFREAFWKEVAKDPDLSSQFAKQNVTRMQDGLAPAVARIQQNGAHRSYVLHHVTPIQHGGGVYDMNNLVVVTPRYHKEILDGTYHYG